MQFVADASWSTQLAAHQLPLPPAGGLVQRLGGPFLYEGEVPVTSPWEIGFRAARIEKNMPKFLMNFDDIWDERKWELELGLELLRELRLRRQVARRARPVHAGRVALPAAGVGDPLRDHVPAARRSTSSSTACAPRTASTPPTSPRCSRGASTRSPRPTGRCGTSPTRPSGSASATSSPATRPTRSATRSHTAGGNASVWLTKFDDFLYVYGHRTEGIADMNIPSWIEDNTSPLGQLANFIAAPATARLRRRTRRRAAGA